MPSNKSWSEEELRTQPAKQFAIIYIRVEDIHTLGPNNSILGRLFTQQKRTQVCNRVQDIQMCLNSVEAKMDKPHIRQREDG